jgi:hypothetical protein
MLENGDLEKIIMNGISFIHHSLHTMINKAIHILTSDQCITNDLTTLITATDILPANTLGKAIKEIIRGWKRLTTMTINTLKNESIQKGQKEFQTASIALKLTDFFVKYVAKV